METWFEMKAFLICDNLTPVGSVSTATLTLALALEDEPLRIPTEPTSTAIGSSLQHEMLFITTIMFPFPSRDNSRQLNIEHSFYTIHVIQHKSDHTHRVCHFGIGIGTGSYGNTGLVRPCG
jgi:hypothetical protein